MVERQQSGRIVGEVTRNIGCCSMAAVTGGREHSPGCVNHVATDKPAPAAVKVPYEAREAGLAALNNDKTWYQQGEDGVWRANYHRAVDLVLEAAAPLLAAHPEPATGVTDEAVERVTAKLYPDLFSDDSLIPEVLRNSGRWQRRHEVRAALEAAQPYMGVRPVVDREAVWRGIYSAVIQQLNPSEITDIATDAVMKQLQPRPTREQVDELLQEWRVGPAHRPFDPDFPNELPNYRRKLRNAVMDLLTGGGSETTDEASTLS